jgi:hypothetical protein
MIFSGLKKGQILINIDDGKHKGDYNFNGDEHRRIGNLLAKLPGCGRGQFLTSSSCNHPGEYGFDENYDVSEVMSKAVAHAHEKTAIPVPKGPHADVVIDKLIKGKAFPLALKFLGSGKKGEDVTLVFDEEKDLEWFTGGIRYASRLAR